MTTARTPVVRALLAALAAFLFAPSTRAEAGALQVTPVLVDTTAATSTLTLRNVGDQPLTAQIRILQWRQDGGEDRLEPTEAVIASPPMAVLRPRTDYVVRVVRQSSAPPAGEESYRLLVDELPDPNNRPVNGIALLIRQSIPVFFSAGERAAPKVAWRLETSAGKTVLVGVNSGGRRIRISDLRVVDGRGGVVAFHKGLRGYVLGHSTVRWQPPQSGGFGKLRGQIFVDAMTESGAIHVPVESLVPR